MEEICNQQKKLPLYIVETNDNKMKGCNYMKKKIVCIMLVTGMLLSNLLVACGTKTELPIEPTVGVDVQEEYKDETRIIQDEVVTAMPKALKEMKNLSAESNTEICIDYYIENFEPVQKFGYTLFKEHLQEENPVLSPVSAYVALTMAGDGANGNTYDEFCNVLGDMTVMSDYMMNEFPVQTDDLKVQLANSVWIDDEFTADDYWVGCIKSFYDAQAFQNDLKTEQTMQAMNEWVNIHTNGLIKDMLEQPLEDETRLVLFNALYFKGMWCNTFIPEGTYEETFYAKDGEIQVPMMHQSMERYEYFSNEDVAGVVMPYREGNYAFVAFMPQNVKDTIRNVYKGMTPEKVKELLESRQNILINLTLPKFEVSFDKKLNDSLKNMGLVDAFDEENADFSRMGTADSGYPICINLVRQKAVVKIDEEGTEAAAVTECVMVDTCALIEKEPIEVCFNRPFGYMIMDMETQIPLFMGIMDNPVEE